MKSLLDNRKDMTPQQSMESLVKYARKQDDALTIRRVRYMRASMLLQIGIIGSISFYAVNELVFGYWGKIHPRNTLSTIMDVLNKKFRIVYAPEIYLKDMERWNNDLQNKKLEGLKASQIAELHH